MEPTHATLADRWLGPLARGLGGPAAAAGRLATDPLAAGAAVFLILVVIAAVFAPYLTPYAAQGIGEPDIVNRFVPPSLEHPLGTDQLGRDVLARILFGARTSLAIAFGVVVFATIVGTFLGAVAGYFGGWLDELIMRITDVFLAFPPLLLAITVAAVLQPSARNTVLAVGLTWWPWYTRLVRAQAASLRQRDFVRASRSIGVRDLTIVRRHILPNVTTPVLVQVSLDLGAAILTATSLSFLGLGVQPPTADWGVMVSEGRLFVLSGYWWIAGFAGLAIFLTTLAFNLVGDGVQLMLDPRRREET